MSRAQRRDQQYRRGMNNEAKPITAPDEAALTILLKDGRVSVNGPLQNKMLCYAMLEVARDTINEFSSREQPTIQAVERPPLLVPGLVADGPLR